MATALPFVVGGKENSKHELFVSEPWISERNPHYPIDLELALQSESELERIEIVSHNQFPPKRLELLTKNGRKWTSIGEVTFKSSKNQKHELKTIFLDDRISSLILRFHECQSSENKFNQVGIVDVKVFGTTVPGSVENSLFAKENSMGDAEEKFTFTTELEEIDKKVKINKERCVKEENFELAKQAQMAERLLARTIGQMKELERDKMVAVKDEDYQRAADLRLEMQTMRTHILASIDSRLTGKITKKTESFIVRPDNLFDEDESEEERKRPKISSPVAILPNEERKIESRNSHRSHQKEPNVQVTEKEKEKKPEPSVVERVPEDPKPPKKPKSRSRSVHCSRSVRSVVSKSAQPVNKFMEKENMVVPAISKKNRKMEKQESTSDNESTEEDYMQVVWTKDHVEATKAAKILGEDTMNKIFSRKLDRRKEGIREAKRQMQKSSADNARQILDAVAFVLSKSLKDSLFSVYGTALDLLRSCVLDFMPKHNLSQQSGKLADATINPLLTKLSPTATDRRTPQTTEEVLLEILLSDPQVSKAFLPKLLTSSATSKKAEIVSTVAEHYDAPNNQAGISEESLRNYAGNCLASSQHEVRSRGRQLILRVYGGGDRRAARNVLPTESRRASLVEGIIREMDVIDRKGY